MSLALPRPTRVVPGWRRWHRPVIAAAVTACGFVPLADAAFTPISQPDAAYISKTTSIPVPIGDGGTTTALADGLDTVTFSRTMTAATAWGTWNNWGSPPNAESAWPTSGRPPRVVYDASAGTVTLTLSQPVGTFGVEVQPKDFGTYSVTADFFDGTAPVGSITRSVTVPGAPVGSSTNGALLFAAATDRQFTKVVLSVSDAKPGLGLANVRYAIAQPAITQPAITQPQAQSQAVPALPRTGLAILAGMLGLFGASAARRARAPR